MSDKPTFVYLKRLIKPLVLALLAAASKHVESTWLERWKGRLRQMAHHKRKRAKAQRAGCYCSGKLSKSHGSPLRHKEGADGRASFLRLRERGMEAA